MVSKAKQQQERILIYMYNKRTKESIETIPGDELAEKIRQFEINKKYTHISKRKRGTRDDTYRQSEFPRYMKALIDNKLVKREEQGIYSLTSKGFRETQQKILDKITLRNMTIEKFEVKIENIDDKGMKVIFLSKDKELNKFLDKQDSKASKHEIYDLFAKSFQTMAQVEAATILDEKREVEADSNIRKELIETTDTTFQDVLRHQAINLNYIADKIDTLDTNTKGRLRNIFIKGGSPTDFLVEALTEKTHEYLRIQIKLFRKNPIIAKSHLELLEQQNNVVSTILEKIKDTSEITSDDIEGLRDTIITNYQQLEKLSSEVDNYVSEFENSYLQFTDHMPLMDSSKMKREFKQMKKKDKIYPLR